MLQNFRIGSRLAFGFGSLILGAIATFGAAVATGHQGQGAISRVHREASARLDIVSKMRDAQLGLVSTIRSAALQTEAPALNADVDRYRLVLKSLGQAEAEFVRLNPSSDQRMVLDKAIGLRKQAEPMVDEAIRFAISLAGEEAAKVLTGRFAPIEHEWALQLDRLDTLQKQQASDAEAEIVRGNDRQLVLLAGVQLAMLIAAALFARATTRSVTRPLLQASQVAARIAAGDLAVSIPSDGKDEAAELLRSLRDMAQQLASMVGEVRDSAQSIDMASREISQGNNDLSTRTELQAGSVQETASALQSLTAVVSQNAGHADAARRLASSTSDIAQRGDSAMTDVAATMSRISESSHRIGEIIAVIDGIAFQTNILALNAAVEAARAGEQGRGFAVVASEVRTLAHRVSSAAAEVRTLIGESVARVDDGNRQVKTMTQTMQTLRGSIDSVGALVEHISVASTSQSVSIVQVNDAVRSIDNSTQQNSALVEEVAGAAQSLSGQTERLAALVGRFRTA